MAERLQQRLVRIFPDMAGIQFDHVWTGKCGGTFDITPRIGCHDGVHYGSGYCFAGVPMGTLFGTQDRAAHSGRRRAGRACSTRSRRPSSGIAAMPGSCPMR